MPYLAIVTQPDVHTATINWFGGINKPVANDIHSQAMFRFINHLEPMTTISVHRTTIRIE